MPNPDSPNPTAGGSYLRDPATDGLQPQHQTKPAEPQLRHEAVSHDAGDASSNPEQEH